jgi:hypothetical protein
MQKLSRCSQILPYEEVVKLGIELRAVVASEDFDLDAKREGWWVRL